MEAMISTKKKNVGKPGGNRLLEIPECRWKIILKWVLKKQCVCGLGSSGSG
jgi:hypothetical protein